MMGLAGLSPILPAHLGLDVAKQNIPSCRVQLKLEGEDSEVSNNLKKEKFIISGNNPFHTPLSI